MTDALLLLQKWNRKHYHFSITSSGNYMPGDGVAVELSAAGRKVRKVCFYEEDLVRRDAFSSHCAFQYGLKTFSFEVESRPDIRDDFDSGAF